PAGWWWSARGSCRPRRCCRPMRSSASSTPTAGSRSRSTSPSTRRRSCPIRSRRSTRCWRCWSRTRRCSCRWKGIPTTPAAPSTTAACRRRARPRWWPRSPPTASRRRGCRRRATARTGRWPATTARRAAPATAGWSWSDAETEPRRCDRCIDRRKAGTNRPRPAYVLLNGIGAPAGRRPVAGPVATTCGRGPPTKEDPMTRLASSLAPAALALALGASTQAALPPDRDACLVGTWNPVGNGAAEWVERQAPGIRMAITHQAATLVLLDDGRYREHTRIQASTTAPGGERARSDAHSSAAGQWRSPEGTLTLAPSRSEMGGTVKPDPGAAFILPEAQVQATDQAYICRGDELETRLQIPGIADPIVQRYRRE